MGWLAQVGGFGGRSWRQAGSWRQARFGRWASCSDNPRARFVRALTDAALAKPS